MTYWCSISAPVWSHHNFVIQKCSRSNPKLHPGLYPDKGMLLNTFLVPLSETLHWCSNYPSGFTCKLTVIHAWSCKLLIIWPKHFFAVLFFSVSYHPSDKDFPWKNTGLNHVSNGYFHKIHKSTGVSRIKTFFLRPHALFIEGHPATILEQHQGFDCTQSKLTFVHRSTICKCPTNPYTYRTLVNVKSECHPPVCVHHLSTDKNE